MMRLTLAMLSCVLLLSQPGQAQQKAAKPPKTSADVVTFEFQQGSLADGLETFYVRLKIAKGWQMYGNPADGKGLADKALKIEFFCDDRAVMTQSIQPGQEAKEHKSKAGERYKAYDREANITCWLFWEDDTKDAKVVSVRVRITAMDGTKDLPAATLKGEVRRPPAKKP